LRFLVDNQLPLQLARCLEGLGHDAVHVVEVGTDEADDQDVWRWAIGERRTVISKDEDLFFLATRAGDAGSLLWIRMGNCRKAALIDAFDRSIDAVVAAFASGQQVVELS
jgi:predicted nuclease of predicted toxin-antitoxin system